MIKFLINKRFSFFFLRFIDIEISLIASKEFKGEGSNIHRWYLVSIGGHLY